MCMNWSTITTGADFMKGLRLAPVSGRATCSNLSVLVQLSFGLKLFLQKGSQIRPSLSNNHRCFLGVVTPYYLPPAGREIIKRIPCVCSCVIECVSRFYKGLYITLVVSPWPFQCFLWPYCLCPFIWCCYFTPRTIAKWVIAMVATLSKMLITPKRLHLECFCKIRCSATFSMPTRWYHF